MSKLVTQTVQTFTITANSRRKIGTMSNALWRAILSASDAPSKSKVFTPESRSIIVNIESWEFNKEGGPILWRVRAVYDNFVTVDISCFNSYEEAVEYAL